MQPPQLTASTGGADNTAGLVWLTPRWLDLHCPDAEALAAAEAATGLVLPTRESLVEIENSSRLRARGGAISVTLPIIHRDEDGLVHPAPVSCTLTPELIVTQHFSELAAVQAVRDKYTAEGEAAPSSLEVFVEICEAVVDQLADRLEGAAAHLRLMSAKIFHTEGDDGNQAIRSNRKIRAHLRQLGRLADSIAETRDILLGVGRAAEFVDGRSEAWAEPSLRERLTLVAHDVASLTEFEVHLSDKTQFLLDAMVGLIGIAQNEVFKVLTIVSLAGIPPTLIAGIYGMNFKNMPEYNWSWGYQYGLAVIALSGLLPLAWFKWRRWF